MIILGRLIVLFGLINIIRPLERFGIQKRSVGAAIIFIGILLVNLGLNANSTPSERTLSQLRQQQSSGKSEPVQLELIETHIQTGENPTTRYIVGTVKNSADIPFRNIKIDFSTYNESDVQSGETFAETSRLEPGQVWNFIVPIFDPDARKYKANYISAQAVRPSWLLRLLSGTDK